MFRLNQLIILFATFCIRWVHNSEDLDVKSAQDQENQPSIHSPLKIYRYPSPNPVQTYLYFPSDGHYEIVDYIEDEVPHKKLESIKVHHPKNIKKVVKSDHDKVSTLKESGKKFEDSYHRKYGYKTNEGYNKDEKYSKGRKGSYEKHYDSDDEKAEKQKKASSVDDGEHSENNDEHEEKEKGEKYNAKKDHQKGSKSKGYHNVFMKDEYKKDHIFFDKEDDKGHYSKHGSEHKKHHNDEHELIKGSHSDAGKSANSKKKKSSSDKKEYDIADEKYKKESKHKSNENDGEKYYFNNGKSSYNVAIQHTS